MKVLVIAETLNGELKASTWSTLTAAHQLSPSVDVVVYSVDDKAAHMLRDATGIDTVFSATAEHLAHPVAEDMVPLVIPMASNYTHILAPATTFGKNVAPRLAAKMDVSQVSDIIAIEDAHTFVRPIYAGNALATVQSADKIKVLTVRTTAFEASVTNDGRATVEALSVPAPGPVTFESLEAPKSERPELTSARVVVSGGRGLQSKENYALIEQLADKLGAAVGASRAIVDAGFVPNDYQVGQTGKIVAPDLYIAVGISGAIQHLAGIKDSKIIVAINKDPDAPIFQVADYGVVGDLFEILPALEAAITTA